MIQDTFEDVYTLYLEERRADSTKNTVKSIRAVMDKFITFNKGKNIFQLSKDEVAKSLVQFNSNSVKSLTVYVCIIKKLMEFAICNLKLDVDLENFSFNKDELKEIVEATSCQQRYISRDELYNMMKNNSIKNPRDKLLVLLIFETILGKEGSEIVHIKEKDVDIENKQITIQRVSRDLETISQTINIEDNRFWEVAQEVVASKIYYKNTIRNKGYVELSYEFVDTENLIKPINYRNKYPYIATTEFRKISSQLIQKDLGLKGITVSTLYISGLIDKLLKETDYLMKYSEVSAIVNENNWVASKYSLYEDYKLSKEKEINNISTRTVKNIADSTSNKVQENLEKRCSHSHFNLISSNIDNDILNKKIICNDCNRTVTLTYELLLKNEILH